VNKITQIQIWHILEVNPMTLTKLYSGGGYRSGALVFYLTQLKITITFCLSPSGSYFELIFKSKFKLLPIEWRNESAMRGLKFWGRGYLLGMG